MILIIGGCITGYGYWLENSADEILLKEVPHQESILTNTRKELQSLQQKGLCLYEKYEESQKKYEEYWQQKIIGQAAMALFSPFSILSSLGPMKEFGTLFDLLNTMKNAAEVPDKIAEIEGAITEIKIIQGYYKQYQAIQKKIKEKERLSSAMEEKIERLKDTARKRSKNAPLMKIGGTASACTGTLGLLIVALITLATSKHRSTRKR